jgi:hypothetical protein
MTLLKCIYSTALKLFNLRFILILSWHLRLCPPPLFILTTMLYKFLVFHTCYMSCLSHSPSFSHHSNIGEKYKLCSSSLCSFVRSPVTSSLLGPNILLSTLFWNTIYVCSLLRARDQFWRLYKTTGKIIVPYTKIFSPSGRRRLDKRFWTAR